MEPQTINPQPQAPPAQPAPQPTPVSVPDVWPGAWGIYKSSKHAVRQNWKVLLGLAILSVVLDGAPSSFLGHSGSFVGLLLSTPASIALIVALLASVRGQTPTFGSSLSVGVDPATYLRYLGNALLVGILLGVSLIALIVPFFFVLPRLVLSTYFLIDRKLGPIEAIKASWGATKGHSGKVWGIIGASIAMALLMLTVIGIPFALYFLFMYSAANAVLYEFIGRSHPVDAAAPVPAPESPESASQAPPSQPPVAQ